MKTKTKRILVIEVDRNEADLIQELIDEGLPNVRNKQAGKEPQRPNYTESESKFINELRMALKLHAQVQ